MTARDRDQSTVTVTETVTLSVSVSGEHAQTLAGLRELVRAAESAGFPDDTRFNLRLHGDRRLGLRATREREIPNAKSASHVPSAIEIADALRAGPGRDA